MADMYGLARKAFTQFNSLWTYDDANGVYLWQKSNQMHAYLVFCNRADKAKETDPAWSNDFWSQLRTQMLMGDGDKIQGNYAIFNRILTTPKQRDGDWADDFGWAGVSCVTASQFFESPVGQAQFGPKAAVYADNWATLAVLSLNVMWSRYVLNYGNPIINGISNGPANGTPADGTWNTVTNANCFALSMKVADLLKNYNGTDPLKVAAKLTAATLASLQYNWFRTWINQKAAPPKIPYNYFHYFPGGGWRALIEAQPHTDPNAAPEYTYSSTTHPNWWPGAVWTGDQGLFAYAMSAFWAETQLAEIPPLVTSVVYGAWESCGNTSFNGTPGTPYGAGDNIIREPPAKAVYDDPGDYVCGRGVMCRFFADPATQALLASSAANFPLSQNFKWMFHETAQAITFSDQGYLNPDIGDVNSMNQSIAKFISVWGPPAEFQYTSGFWGQISFDAVVLCQEVILAFDLVGAWLAVQSSPSTAVAEETGATEHHHHKAGHSHHANGHHENGHHESNASGGD